MKAGRCHAADSCTKHESRVCYSQGDCALVTPAQLWSHIKAEVAEHPSFKEPEILAKVDCGYIGHCHGAVTPEKLLKALPNVSKQMLEELGIYKPGRLERFGRKLGIK